MAHCTPRRRTRQIEALRTQFAQDPALPFADVLTAERIQEALKAEKAGWREILFTPVLTLWAFLSQVSAADGSCRATVARVLAWLVSRGQKPCSPETDPYCKARQRLPEGVLQRLLRQTGRDLHQRSPDAWLWQGRRVKVADGTTVSMPDTPENQAAYPQPAGQKPGLGFPIARLVVVFCLACGTALDAALGRYPGKETGETALLRSLDDALAPGDVLLADRYYGGWFDLALRQRRGVDSVVRLHQRRVCDMRRGRRLGREDHIVRWPKPARPAWLDEATYAALPDSLEVREVRVHVAEPGFRTQVFVVVTTLLDGNVYPARELAGLYRLRWRAELNLRSLKATLGMDILRCKSPEMVRKEVWAHLLAYNLIRAVMAQTAVDHDCTPHDLSFTGALQAVRGFAERLLDAETRRQGELYDWLVLTIGAYVVGDRPGRVEPRAVQRRPKEYARLTVPREQARKRLGV